MGDLELVQRDDGYYDLSFENGDLQLGKSLESSVLVSIGSDARGASRSFMNKLQDDGWWGEPTFVGDSWGCRLHTLRIRNSPNFLLLARQYVEDSLRWLVEDGVASSVSADVRNAGGFCQIDVTITYGGTDEHFRYEFAWKEVA